MWPSGEVQVCKTFYGGSNPPVASKNKSLCTMQRLLSDKDLMNKRGEGDRILEVYIPRDNCQNLLVHVKCHLFLTKIAYLNLF